MDSSTDRDSEATRTHRLDAQEGTRRNVPAEGDEQALVAAKLEQAREASRQGHRQQAYQLSRELTHLTPDNADAWLYRAAFADTYEQRLASLNKALSLAPGDPQAWRSMYETLLRYLEQDPFLRYLDETEGLYRVLTGAGRAVTVPKGRATAPPYPPPEPTPLHQVFRWLGFALLGLPLAGVGTVICAPVAALFALRMIQKPLPKPDRRSAIIAVLVAGLLWLIGLFLTFLLVLHL